MSQSEKVYDHPHEAHHHPGEEHDKLVVDRPGFFVGSMIGAIAGAGAVILVLLLVLLGTGVIGGATAP